MSHRIVIHHDSAKTVEAPSHAMGETEYGRFLPTHEVIRSIPRQFSRHPYDINYNLTATKISANSAPHSSGNGSDDCALIAEFLKGLGFRRLSGDIKHGFFAIVFEGNDHQMIRLVDKAHDESNRVVHPMVLQPLRVFNLRGRYAIEVLPKVHTLYEVLANRNSIGGYGRPLIINARREFDKNGPICGLSVGDGHINNLAVIPGIDGKPVLLALDPGQVTYNPHLYTPRRGPKDSRKIMEYYAASQQAYLKSLGLKEGELKGVLDADALERKLHEFAAQRKHTEATQAVYAQALEKGVSSGEFGAAARNAAKGDREKGGFCERIRQELSERHNLPTSPGDT